LTLDADSVARNVIDFNRAGIGAQPVIDCPVVSVRPSEGVIRRRQAVSARVGDIDIHHGGVDGGGERGQTSQKDGQPQFAGGGRFIGVVGE
jgi:hypothetical protein